ncbi:conserved Plasmodium protein, unknown function [Plasmodium gallinaceum]|uniref:Alpha/beta hydrolase n=1 Tax=Plasmodium gallinaceum TaxID=5849 RepID=A0A1J1GQP2_PLAGA|nr:conserved Plasmodium protein, unknown function [Plasmodium gallinaceum]CRG94779.1 conserved Plasmodium protein, unknown function [Plasmodium gallinaceum]
MKINLLHKSYHITTIMFFKKLFKIFKKNSSSIFFLITLLYFLYTYVSIFLYIFNNALFYLFVNISFFYLCFHFVVRALTYPGSLFIFYHKTNYDNRIEICKFYLKETVKLTCLINDVGERIKEIAKNDDKTNDYIMIKLEQLFSDYNNKDAYFNFFSSLNIFYTLYISYYLYINLEENADLSDEQLNFYYYLKFFMIRINEIKVYINKSDIIYPELFTEIKIRRDFNECVNEFMKNKNTLYEQNFEEKVKKENKLNSPYEKWKCKILNYIFNIKELNNSKIQEESKFLISTNNNNNTNRYYNIYNNKPIHISDKINNSNYDSEKDVYNFSDKNKNTYNDFNHIKNENTNLRNNNVYMNNIPSNYVNIKFLSLFYHENYEKSITHVNYKDFFMEVNYHDFLKLLDDLTFFLNKLSDIFKINTLRKKFQIKNAYSFINNFSKNHIAGTLDLFKYEMIYKYYAKQQYMYINKTKIDCMFIPCKKFLNDKMQKYINLKKSGKSLDIYENSSNNNSIFFNAFNNEFYNYIYHNDYLYDIPLVLYFNPNGSYYELNACCSGTIQFYLENNINVFVYNYRGYGKSKGFPNFNKNNIDALKISEYLLSKKVKYLGLHGRSIGGPLCSYVTYHLCNFDKKNSNTELMDKLYKNELHKKRINKQINKINRLMNKKKKKISEKLLFPFKYIMIFLQYITLLKLRVYNSRMKKKMNLNNVSSKKLLNCSNSLENSKISFVCIDKSFYNFEEVAKYMIGEYAYNVLQFTSYKLDITKYYINSNVPKILIYDNYDEIIHYMSNALTGISKEVSKLYKNGKLNMNTQRRKSEIKQSKREDYENDDLNTDDLLPLVENTDDYNIINNINKDTEIEKNNNFYDMKKSNNYKNNNLNRNSINILNEKPHYNDIFIIDEYIDNCWLDNKLKNIDFRLFLQSWKILNDCILFLNKSSTTNNSFISIGLETYTSIMSLYNSKEDKLEKQTQNAIYCIYNDNFSFISPFKKVNSTYEDFIMEYMNDDSIFKKTNIYDMLKEDEDFKHEMDKLNKILKDLYMSKRKEIEKVHFTYSGFFLKNDFLYDYINTENRNNDQPAFHIEDIDVITFLNEFSSSIDEIINTINYNLNSCGQLFNELNKVPEKEKVNFLKYFICRMKVFGSYPSQCFNLQKKNEFFNHLYHIPYIFSHYYEKELLNDNEEKKNIFNMNNKNEKEDEKSSMNISKEDIHFTNSNFAYKNRSTINNFSETNRNYFNEDNISRTYVTIKKSMLLHDLIICLNYFKEYNNSSTFNIFYKLVDNTYIIDIKQLLSFLKSRSNLSIKSNKFLDIFANDIGIDANNINLPEHLEKYVSWMRLNNRMTICKIYQLIRNELNKIKTYTEKLTSEYSTISQNTNIQFIIFLIYRISIFKKIITHTYIIYTFFQRLNKSLDMNINQDDLDKNLDIKLLEPIKSFKIFYKDYYKIYSPKVLGFPLLVNSGHNGNLNKNEENFLHICLNSFLKQYI